jgi:hypothetical protein
MTVGLLVNGKCVTCKNSNGRCVHNNVYDRSQGQGKDDSGVFFTAACVENKKMCWFLCTHSISTRTVGVFCVFFKTRVVCLSR